MEFDSLEEVAKYIMRDENASKYIWRNCSGDWNIDEIILVANLYDFNYSKYTLFLDTYNIYGDGKNIFTFLKMKGCEES